MKNNKNINAEKIKANSQNLGHTFRFPAVSSENIFLILYLSNTCIVS